MLIVYSNLQRLESKMDTMICACDLDAVCDTHMDENDRMTWPEVLGIRPTPMDSRDAYDGSYKSKFWEGWN